MKKRLNVKKIIADFGEIFAVFPIVLKASWKTMSPFYFYFALIIAKGVFINSGKGVLAYHGEGLEPFLLYHVFLLLIVNFAMSNWSDGKKLSKAKKEHRGKIADKAHRVVAGLALVLSLISFFPRQVLYADRIDTFDEVNRLVESVSLEGATVSGIAFEERKGRYSSRHYYLHAKIKVDERYFEYKMEVKNLRKLCDILYEGRKPEIAVYADFLYGAYVRTHKNLSAEDREFLAAIVGR